MTLKALQDIETLCLRKFRARAKKIAAENPGMRREIAFAMATQAMPRTAVRYEFARSRLALAGISAQPLFE
jgi:hypothetical protein